MGARVISVVVRPASMHGVSQLQSLGARAPTCRPRPAHAYYMHMRNAMHAAGAARHALASPPLAPPLIPIESRLTCDHINHSNRLATMRWHRSARSGWVGRLTCTESDLELLVIQCNIKDHTKSIRHGNRATTVCAQAGPPAGNRVLTAPLLNKWTHTYQEYSPLILYHTR